MFKSIRMAAMAASLTLVSVSSFGQVKILFDATKAEMAGNADWIIDADLTNLKINSSGLPYVTGTGTKSNPQRVPTPAQSGITASTSETYWSGGLSSWAVDCAKRGYTVESLPYDGQITYGNTANVQDLSNYNIFVVDEPNILFTATEKTAIVQFVRNGGRLFIIADHTSSDRNNDGQDSPEIWNDLFTNNSVQSNPFGMSFDLVDISQTSSAIYGSSTDTLIHGPMGDVTQVMWSGGTTMTLSTSANSTVKGVAFKTGTGSGSSNNVMVAYSRYGSGKVVAMGDSSPADDGTGNASCTLYDGYWTDASGNHRKLIMNATIWLASGITTGIDELNNDINISVYPNPSNGVANITSGMALTNVEVSIIDMQGKLVTRRAFDNLQAGSNNEFQLNAGMYFVQIHANEGSYTTKLIVE